jgi:hypothetical protein
VKHAYPDEVYKHLEAIDNVVPGHTVSYLDADALTQALMEDDNLVEWTPCHGGTMLAVTTKGRAELKRRKLEPPRWLGNGRIQIGEEIIVLEDQQAGVMAALVELGAATQAQLVKRSGYKDAVKVLKHIKKKWPELAPHIQTPWARGSGGYRTTIKKAE